MSCIGKTTIDFIGKIEIPNPGVVSSNLAGDASQLTETAIYFGLLQITGRSSYRPAGLCARYADMLVQPQPAGRGTRGASTCIHVQVHGAPVVIAPGLNRLNIQSTAMDVIFRQANPAAHGRSAGYLADSGARADHSEPA